MELPGFDSFQIRRESKIVMVLAAHLTWISLVSVIITMIVMISGFKSAGISLGPGQKPPASVPEGVVALVGYANRFLIVVYIYWLLLVANTYIRISKSKGSAEVHVLT